MADGIESTADERRIESNDDTAASAETERVTDKRLLWTTGTIAFAAWTLSVYDFLLFGNLLPVIRDYFGWTTAATTRLTIWVGIGTFLVALTVGPITDYFGRVKALMITVAGASISSLLAGLTAWVPAGLAFGYLAVVRSLSGYGYSEQAVNTTYLSELFPSDRRGYLYSFIQGGWPVGALLTTAFILWLQPVLEWYWLFIIATFPLVLLFFARMYLPESPRFEQLQEVRRLARNGETDRAQEVADRYGISEEKASSFTIQQLFEPEIRQHTVALSAAFILNWMGIHIMTVLITLVLTEAKGIEFTSTLYWVLAANVLGFVGYVVHGLIGDRIGRRETIMGAWMIAGVALTAMLLVDGVLAVGTLYVIGLFFFLGSYSALFTYMGESFPTRARGTGASFVNSMGPLGAVVGSLVITFLQEQGLDIGTAAIIAGSVPIFLSGVILYWANHVDPGQELEAIIQ